MIYTRFGTPVELVESYGESGVIIRYEDGKTRRTEIVQLKADGGLGEIRDAIEAAGRAEMYLLHDPNTGETHARQRLTAYRAEWRNQVLREEGDDRRWIDALRQPGTAATLPEPTAHTLHETGPTYAAQHTATETYRAHRYTITRRTSWDKAQWTATLDSDPSRYIVGNTEVYVRECMEGLIDRLVDEGQLADIASAAWLD